MEAMKNHLTPSEFINYRTGRVIDCPAWLVNYNQYTDDIKAERCELRKEQLKDNRHKYLLLICELDMKNVIISNKTQQGEI